MKDNIIQFKVATKLALNSHPLFAVLDKEGKPKPWIERAFLSPKWLSAEDADHGWLPMDGKVYRLSMTQALATALCQIKDSKVRAICSFQTLINGDRRVIAKLMEDNKTSLKQLYTQEELDERIKRSMARLEASLAENKK